MQWQLLFFSMAPIVAFVAVRSKGRLRTALLAAVAVAAIELLYNSFQLGAIEPFSLTSFALFGILGGAAYFRDDARLFELQPVVLEVIIAAVFLYYDLVLETPLFAVILEEKVGLHEILPAYQRGYATVYATALSRSLPYLLLVHAAVTAWAAVARSLWYWFHVRVFGFYGMVAMLFLAERILGVEP